MDTAGLAVAGTVTLVLAVAAVSGPLVPGVDFTRESAEQTAPPGSGSVDARVLAVPEDAALVKGDFGAGAYYLRVADATVDVASVTGQPLLVYKLRIPAMGYVRGTTHFLSPEMDGHMAVALEEDSLDPEKVEQSSYRGELLLLVRDDADERLLYRENVTVAVED